MGQSKIFRMGRKCILYGQRIVHREQLSFCVRLFHTVMCMALRVGGSGGGHRAAGGQSCNTEAKKLYLCHLPWNYALLTWKLSFTPNSGEMFLFWNHPIGSRILWMKASSLVLTALSVWWWIWETLPTQSTLSWYPPTTMNLIRWHSHSVSLERCLSTDFPGFQPCWRGGNEGFQAGWMDDEEARRPNEQLD